MNANHFELNAGQEASVVLTGHRLFKQGRNKEARHFFEGLTLLQPENAYAHGILGAIHQREQNHEAALQHYIFALRLAPNDLYLLTNRGEILLRKGFLQEAADDFRKVISLDPHRKHPAAARARLLVASAIQQLEHAKKELQVKVQ
jgi:tetratricopeptide (TPR) repeat protein